MRREIDLVDDQEITASDAGSAFARNLVSAGDIDYVDPDIDQFGTEGGGQVVAAAFDEDQFQTRERALEFVDSFEIHRGVFADGGMRAATGFDAADVFPRKSALTE